MIGIIPAGMVLFLALWCGVISAETGTAHGIPDQGGIASGSGEAVFEGRAEPGKAAKAPDVKGMALADAERNALLEAVRPVVHPVIFEREKDFLARVLTPGKGRILDGAQVVAEEATDSGGFRVTMKARVRGDVAEEVLLKGLARRTILMSGGTADGKTVKGYWPGAALSSSLRRKGYTIVDLAGVNDEKTKGLMAALKAGDRETGRPLFIWLLAGSVIESHLSASFSEKTGEMYSSRATGYARIARPAGDRAVLAVRGVKGFGSTKAKASLDAVDKASSVLAVKVVKCYSGRNKRK